MIPGWGRFPGGGHGILFLHSCLENPMDRGAWRATVHGVTKNQTQLKPLSLHTGQSVKRGQDTDKKVSIGLAKKISYKKPKQTFLVNTIKKDNQNFKIDCWELATSGKPHQVLPGPGIYPPFIFCLILPREDDFGNRKALCLEDGPTDTDEVWG